MNSVGKLVSTVILASACGPIWADVLAQSTEVARLTASDAARNDSFGTAVAADGNTAVVGAYGKAANLGVAYVFTLAGSTWAQQAILSASDGSTNAWFGRAVAVANDTVVVGAANKSGGGAAYVFVRTGAGWSQQAKLVAPDLVTGDSFGGAVAVNGDTIVIGAPAKGNAGTGNPFEGAVYIYARTAGLWTLQAKLYASDPVANGAFGAAVAINGDTAVIGQSQTGAHVFVRANLQWTEQAELYATDTYGNSAQGVAVTGDTVAFVGANPNGAAYIFQRTSTPTSSSVTTANSNGAVTTTGDLITWTQQATLTASEGGVPVGPFGSIGLSGSQIVIGVPTKTIGTNVQQGAAYVFSGSGQNWQETGKLTGSNSKANDLFGSATAIAGNTIVIGAPVNTFATGAAYVFAPPAQLSGIGPVFGSSIQATPNSFAPGEIVSLYGSRLCPAQASASPPLPTHLAVCAAIVDGQQMPLYFVSPGQINAVLPQLLSVGTHQIIVQQYSDSTMTVLTGQVGPLSFTVSDVSLDFVERTDTTGPLLAAQNLDGTYVGATNPTQSGNYLTLYLTGLGQKTAVFPEGVAPGTAVPAVAPVQVFVNGVSANLTYMGSQPTFPGLDQVVFQMPSYALQPGKSTVNVVIVSLSAFMRQDSPAAQTVVYSLPAK